MSIVIKKPEIGQLHHSKGKLAETASDCIPLPMKHSEFGTPQAEFDKNSRADSYSRAHTMYPLARKAELDATLHLIGPCHNKIIVEVGAGQGFLTEHLVASAGPHGQVHAVDNSQSQLDALKKRCAAVNILKASTEHIPLKNKFADVVVSLANFHHVASKQTAFSECVRILKPGGSLILVDVCHGTPVQAYFDKVVDKICSTGHQHTFLDQENCVQLCARHKLEIDSWQILEVPWQFDSKESAANFLNWVHDATCSPAESLAHAAKYLDIQSDTVGKKIHVGWQLFFLSARKSVQSAD